MDAARSKLTTLKQICDLIPPHLIPKLAKEHGVEEKCRTFDQQAMWCRCCSRKSPTP